MTIKEFYEWAKKNKVENCKVTVKDDLGYKFDVEPVLIKNISTSGSSVEVQLWKKRY